MDSIALTLSLVIGVALAAVCVAVAAERLRTRRNLAAVLLAGLTLLSLGGVVYAARWVLLPCGWRSCPLREAAATVKRRTIVVDRDRTFVDVLQPGFSPWLSLDSMPRHLPAAVIAAEDRRFWQHSGTDFIGVGRAVVRNIQGHREGASTIAFQASQCLLGPRGAKVLEPDGTVAGKLAEMSIGWRMISTFGKEATLEIYLNCVPFLSLVGVDAAARHYFAKSATRLSLAESATLAAMIRAPDVLNLLTRPERVLQERNRVLVIMREMDAASPQAVNLALRAGITRRRQLRRPGTDFLAALRREFAGGLVGAPDTLHTSLDVALELEARRNLQRALDDIERRVGGPRRPPLQGLFVAADAHSGEIRAYVPCRPDGLGCGFDRIAVGRVRLASAIKPFLLASAVESEAISPEMTVTQLEERARPRAPGPWRRSLEARSDRRRTIYEGLAASDNYVAYLLWEAIPTAALDRLDSLGFPSASPVLAPEALGTRTISPLRLVAAYGSMVNGGRLQEPRLLRYPDSVPQGPTVWQPWTTQVVQAAMRQVVASGTARRAGAGAADRMNVGLKTGTTENNWEFIVCGYARRHAETLVACMWIGFDQPRTIVATGDAGTLLAPWWIKTLVGQRWPGTRGAGVRATIAAVR